MKSKKIREREPWVAEGISTAFQDAQRQCLAFRYADPKHLTFCITIFILEEERRIFGADSWARGFNANRTATETFVRYAYEQGYIPRISVLEDLFAQNTL